MNGYKDSSLDTQGNFYPSTTGDNDFVIATLGATPVVESRDGFDLEVMSDHAGVAKIGIRARDFGGRTTIQVRNADGDTVAKLKIPLDEDEQDKSGDTLADIWEDMYNMNLPTDFTGFDRAKRRSVAGIDDAARDDDRNEGGQVGKNGGDRLPAFDEYRGFFIGGIGGGHKRTSPAVKQIFVHSPDHDFYITADLDGLNRDPIINPMEVGAYASDIDAEILLINGEEDSDISKWEALAGDVNYNSPAPHINIKQKYVWVVTDGRAVSTGRSFDQPIRGPNRQTRTLADPNPGPNPGRVVASIDLEMVRTNVAFIDGNGSAGPGGALPQQPQHTLVRGAGGLPANALLDAERHLTTRGPQPTSVGLYYFAAADKVRWNDRNGDTNWDRGDELWIDVNGDQTYDAADLVIFDHIIDALTNTDKLALNTAGVLLGNTSEFRYAVRNRPDAPGQYNDGDYIYTAYFNRDLYTASRDHLLARSIVGVTTELPLDSGATIMIGFDPGATAYTANGLFYVTNEGATNYIDPPSTFKDTDQDTSLQLRE